MSSGYAPHRDREDAPTGAIARIENGTARGAGRQGPGTRDAPKGALGSDLQRNWGGTPALFYRYSPSPQGETNTEMDL